MKEGIHPTFYPDALFTCGSCGTTWRAGSTKKEVHLDICSNCHPFFTGTQRIVDTAGQVERFTKRLAARESIAPQGEVRPNKKTRRAQERAKRSGMLEATQPEPTPAVVEPAAVAGETAPVAQAQTEAAAPEANPPRQRKPRPPRERKPRPEPPVQPAAETPAPADTTAESTGESAEA